MSFGTWNPGVDSALAGTTTTAQVASTLNASSQVTATGGTGSAAAAEPSFNLQSGTDGDTRLTLTRSKNLWTG
jgi:hypothetical protein